MLTRRTLIIWTLIALSQKVLTYVQRGYYGNVCYCDNERNYYHDDSFICNISITNSDLPLSFSSAGVQSPEFVYCRHCVIEYIPRGIFTAYTNMRSLIMRHSQIKYLPANVIEGYSLNTIDLSGNKISILNTPSIFRQAPNLQEIDLSRNEIKEINVEAFGGLKFLRTLLLSQNNIEILKEETFQSLVNLQNLKLDNNMLKGLDANTFLNNLNLFQLTLNNNKIQSIDDGVFDTMSKLELLDLSLNSLIINESISVNAITVNITKSNIRYCNVMEKVQFLDATDNRMKFINFTNSSNLETVNLRTNELIIIEFGETEHLKLIDLSNNYLAEVNLGYAPVLEKIVLAANNLTNVTFELMENLNELDLSNNSIEEIDFENTPNLIKLNLSRNNIVVLPALPTALVTLDLAFNRISNIELSTFADLEALEFLNLENCGLRVINYGTFSHQNRLQLLDISFNSLGTIDLNMFYALAKLTALFIDGNNLTDLYVADIHSQLPALEKIGLSDNKWSCTKLIAIVKILQKYKIAVYIERAVKTTSNILGISCEHTVNENVGNITDVYPVETVTYATNHDDYLKNIAENINKAMIALKRINKTANEQSTSRSRSEVWKQNFIELKQQLRDINDTFTIKRLSFKDEAKRRFEQAQNIFEGHRFRNEILKSKGNHLKKSNREKLDVLSNRLDNVLTQLTSLELTLNNMEKTSENQSKESLFSRNITNKNNDLNQITTIAAIQFFVIFSFIIGALICYFLYKKA